MKKWYEQDLVHWSTVIIFTILCLYAQTKFIWIKEYPKDYIIPLSLWMNIGMDWFVEWFGWFFRGISWLLEWPVKGVRVLLQSLDRDLSSYH